MTDRKLPERMNPCVDGVMFEYIEKSEVDKMVAAAADPGWVPVAEMPEEWKNGRILAYWEPGFSCESFGRFYVQFYDEEGLSCNPTHVRLPSKGPK